MATIDKGTSNMGKTGQQQAQLPQILSAIYLQLCNSWATIMDILWIIAGHQLWLGSSRNEQQFLVGGFKDFLFSLVLTKGWLIDKHIRTSRHPVMIIISHS